MEKFVFCCAFEWLKKGIEVLFKGKIYKKDEFFVDLLHTTLKIYVSNRKK